MKPWTHALLIALAAVSIPTLVAAQHRDWGGHAPHADRHWSAPAYHPMRSGYRPGPPAAAPRPGPAYGRGYGIAPPNYGYGQPYYPQPRYVAPAYGRWRRGDFLPPSYRGVPIGDYQRFHLRRPPPGYYWSRSGDDFLLVAAASGLIFEVINGDD